jgi:multiple sugar transport system substrate-binding protein
VLKKTAGFLTKILTRKKVLEVKKYRSIICAGLVAILVSILVSNCVMAKKRDAVKKEPVKLTAWVKKTWAPESDQLLAKHLEDFGRANNCTVNVELINSSDMVQKYNAAIESGQIPDVIFLVPYSIMQFKNRGLLMDVSEVVRDIEKNESPFYKNAKNYITFNGKVLGIPLYHENRILIYRKDLLAKAGYSEPPKTWEELRTIAKAVTDPAKNIYGFGDPFAPTDDCVNNQRSTLWSFGAKEVSTNGKRVTINSPETLQVIKLYTDMYQKDKSIPPATVSWDDSGNNNAYLSGQCAMVINLPSILTAMKNPEQKQLKENTGVALVPAGPKGRIFFGNAIYYSGYRKTKNPALVKKLLRSIYNKNWYSSWITKTAPVYCPALQEVGKDSFWQSGANKAIVDSLQYQKYPGYPGPLTIAYSQYEANKMWGAMMQKILVNNVPPQQALKELAVEMNKIFKKNR